MSDNARGAVIMMAAMAAFTLNDAFMKALSGTLPLFQALFLRGVGATLVLAALAWRAGAFRFRPRAADRRIILIRSAAEVGAAWLFVSALFHMPLANATAILQSLPLALTLAGALLLGERVGWRRWLAIVVGFAGVLMIVRPGSEGFNLWSLAALGSVACVVARDLATRRLSAPVPSLAVALAASGSVTLFAAAGSLVTNWVPARAAAALPLAGATACLILGYILSVKAMRHGDIGFVAPFRYTSLIWALGLGFLAFGDWPDPATLAGAVLVAATGIFTLLRERRIARAARAALPPA
jgi:S-adenosylmethionine uptake transporter